MAIELAESESLDAGVRRSVGELLEGYLTTTESTLDEQIHSARKLCKLVRSLLHLIRDGFSEYESENDFFRQQARRLAGYRDRHVVLVEFDGLVAKLHPGTLPWDVKWLRDSIDHLLAQGDGGEAGCDTLLSFHDSMQGVAMRAQCWNMQSLSCKDLIGQLNDLYCQVWRSRKRALHDEDIEKLHQLRKDAKRYDQALAFAKNVCRCKLTRQRKRWHELSETLGDHRNLFLLRDCLDQTAANCEVQARLRKEMLEHIDHDLKRLRQKAFQAASRVLVHKPHEFKRRVRKAMLRLRKVRSV